MENWKDKIEFYSPSEIEVGNIWSKDNNLSRITSDFIELIQGIEFDEIAAIETKGIIYGAALSERLSIPLLIFRKTGKIRHTESLHSYRFKNWRGESDGLEIEKNLLDTPKRILVVDDLADKLNSFGAVDSIINDSHSEIVAFLCFANISGKAEFKEKRIVSLINTEQKENT